MAASGLIGYNKSSGTNKLLCAYGNDIFDVDTGTGYPLNISSSTDSEFEVFLDSVFWQNYSNTPLTFDGSKWNKTHVAHTPIAKYLRVYGTRMYLGYVKLNSTAYPSRVWYSDLPKNNTIQWGLMSGTNGRSNSLSTLFTAAQAGFHSYNVKVGDPLIIEGSTDVAGEYTISEIEKDQRIKISENFKSTQTSLTYWAGGNWFDVRTDDGDVIKALGENNNRLLVFKENSLHRFDGSSLRQVKGVPGTSSTRSVVNIRGVTIYFHGSSKDKTGFYMYDGVTSQRISNAVQPFIDGMSAANFDDVIAWREGDVYRAYIGDLSNTNSSNNAYNIERTKAVFSYDVANNRVFIDTTADVIEAAGYFRESNEEKVFLQNDGGEVFQTPSGNDFGGSDIPFKLELQPYYPRGSEIVNVFTRIKIISRDARGVTVAYKLWDNPLSVDGEYTALPDLENDMTELLIPTDHNKASGFQLRFQETGQTEPTYHIEKVTIYSYSTMLVTPERKEQS